MASPEDIRYMARALYLARTGCGTTTPNPSVGCVLVKQGRIIAEGVTQPGGVPHGEANAIANTLEPVEGATAYVTLEPCAHKGKSPPCTQALIEARVERVVVAMTDPNPLVSGKGVAQLEAAGIKVETGVLESEAQQVNPGFYQRMVTGLPRLRAKLAMSVDGRTAMASGESQWITGSDARDDVQRLRAGSCAIISGVDSVITDDSALTVRLPAEERGSRQPLRLVLDSNLRLPESAKILQQEGQTFLVYVQDKDNRAAQLQAAGAKLVQFPGENGQVDLNACVKWLAEQQCNEVLVECGARLAGAFLQQHLLDEMVIYMAPVLMGNQARPLFDLPLETMAEKVALNIEEIRAVGNDWRLRVKPLYK